MQALEVITDSLRDLGILSEVEAPSPQQGQFGVRKLNELMATLLEDGIDLGWSPITTTTDTVVIPAGHVSTIKAMMSVAQSSTYGIDANAVVAGRASSGYQRLLGQAFTLANERAQSNTLPVGESQRLGYSILTG
jgi:hypothetical protein